MTADTTEAVAYPNGVANGDLKQNPNSNATKKLRESERRRRRRKQKKISKASQLTEASAGEDSDGALEDDAKENADPQKAVEQVEVEYVPEKAELDDSLPEEFRKVFEKFSFSETAASEETDKKDEIAANAASNKKADSDSEEEEEDNQQKEKGISNKKKKLQRRMKIAELKQICSRPDVVEVWDATAADPKLLVYLKSYRNTVPVPRHWCQKRKFLQGNGCDNHGARICRCFAKGTLLWILFYFVCPCGWGLETYFRGNYHNTLQEFPKSKTHEYFG